MIVSRAGQLKNFLSEWSKITTDKFVIGIISGYQIPFLKKPFQLTEPPSHSMSEIEIDKLDRALQKLISSQAVVHSENEKEQFISPIFGVPKSDGSIRLVINLKNLNEFIQSPHFKMEDYRSACTLVRKDYFLAVVDQRDAYHSIPIHPHFQKYLKFRWKGILYKFTCLPFGLNIAPYIYTKMMKPVLSHLRALGFQSVSFLDDCLLIGKNLDGCISNVEATINIYKKLGLAINFQKSILKPTQSIKFLGFIFDTQTLTLKLPETKKEKILKQCMFVYSSQQITIQELAELLGLLVSACPAVKYGSLYTKQLEIEKTKALAGSINYSKKMSLSIISKEDISWWISSIGNACRKIDHERYDIIITTDSSLSGWGAISGGVQTKGYWTVNESTFHINVLELLAIKLAVQIFLKMPCMKVLVRCDNATALAYINNFGGCRSSDCHRVAKEIWQYCEQYDSFIFASYINTKANYLADGLSRAARDSSDFKLCKEIFDQICDKFGTPCIDLFASHHTTQCKAFYSWYPDPMGVGVDAFTHVWEDAFYAFPPFCLLGRVLQKINEDDVRGIVVAPVWKAQPWYPLYIDMAVSNILILKKRNILWCPFLNRVHSLSHKITLMAAVLAKTQ